MRYLVGFVLVAVFGILGCSGGNGVVCQDKVCPCTEAGIRAAIAERDGTFTFDCDGPTTIVTEAEIVIDDYVILDGEGNLILDANDEHRVFFVLSGIVAELRGFTITKGWATGDDFIDADGGGILNYGSLTLADSTVSGNTADGSGGGITNGGTLALTNSTVSANTADGSGGGITNGGTLTMTNSTVSGNEAGWDGGGIYSPGPLTMANSTVSRNTAAVWGGGILNHYDGEMMLTDSTVSGNNARDGGGIFNDAAELRLERGTLSGNTADGGGGILNAGGLTLVNSTVSGNTATVYEGGGILNEGTITMTHSTVSGNTAAGLGGGIYHRFISGTVSLANAIVNGDCEGKAIESFGHNIESPDDTCGFDQPTDRVSIPNPMLGPLQNNGGPTETHALLPGSVAIDRIREAACVDADGQPLATDQRGEPRPAGDGCDVGAFELQP